ncbi:hsp90-like protein [Daldinia vernicosa]|uniref:hsp90-like protein n=1 Tax=Daldinia vernicosa TaxID=114800 RepID=UPI002008DFB3|nr:hsp90-like protein [Daldinia vernicosa]KAI0847327.1 hsp90-like protein [Daldinia vernicosa]
MESSQDPAIQNQPTADQAINDPSEPRTQNDDNTTPFPQPSCKADDYEESTNVPTSVEDIPAVKPKSPPIPVEETSTAVNSDITHKRASNIPSSCSASADSQHRRGTSASNADPSDRVFPIRSVVSVDQSQETPLTLVKNLGEQGYIARRGSTWDGRRRPGSARLSIDTIDGLRRIEPVSTPVSSSLGPSKDKDDVEKQNRGETRAASPAPKLKRDVPAGPLSIFNDASSDLSDKTKSSTPLNTEGSNPDDSSRRRSLGELNDALMTARFRHVITEEGHAVITGRDGSLQRCEDEPIHTPGAVQAFGLLVALREENDGRLTVRCVSENSEKMIGFSPQELFRLESFADILTEEQTDNLLDHIDFIRDEEADPATNGPDVFSISIRPPHKKSIKLWCAIHINESHPELIICEFELEDDQEHPLRPADEPTSDAPQDTLCQTPTVEELHESTETSSRPLRILRSARNRRGGASAMQVFDIMSQVQDQLASAPNLQIFLKILVGIVKELTGFHRVMIYQFDAAFNGKVVTELVDPVQTRDLYYGLHFPASDIPKQARDLYKLNKVRLLYDRDLESARLVCRSPGDLGRPLDLSHAYLRAMSPIHLKYLANMAVRSSMSISINAFDELWGLIACHSYGSTGMRVPFPIRKLCRLVGDTASRNIERLSYASRLQARKLINTMPTDKNPSGYITASSNDLIKLFDADFGMLSIRGETKILGKIEQSQEALAMLEYLRLRKFTSVLTTQDIHEDFPDLHYPPGFSVIAGLLYVPLSVGGNDFIVFFRKGQVREVKWAGNPYEKYIREGTSSYLEPRSSFKAWHELVIGKCRDWSEEQVETAAVLCLVYGKFIEVWRQKEAALQSSRLTRLLLANSAHEVRTPLNAIINCLEIAMEGHLDQETRENLARSHSASKSLIYVINDLLDLTNMEEGQELIKDEVLDLPACIREATEPFKVDAKRKALSYELIEHPGLPRYVHGDYRRVRQVVANITANAMQHTSEGSIRVESYVTEVLESRVKIEIVVQDTGRGMSNEKLDNLFRDLEQVSLDVDSSTSVDDAEKPENDRSLGLGLAMVARILRNMNGQLRLKSEEGKGSRFVIQLPFELPKGESLEKIDDTDAASNPKAISSIVPIVKASPLADANEVMLVDRKSSLPINVPRLTNAETRSFDETRSLSSIKSGTSNSAHSHKSDAERLIDAIQTPLSIGSLEERAANIKRLNLKERQDNISAGAAILSGSGAINPSAVGGIDLEQSAALQQPAMGPSKPSTPSGQYHVTDTRTPIKPVRVPHEYFDNLGASPTAAKSRVLLGTDGNAKGNEEQTGKPKLISPINSGRLQVLVAEDDPINMKILQRRLEKAGHEVYHAVNGEDCATVYKDKPTSFDVILMDMQMPIVDGLTSTKMIRAFEKSDKGPDPSYSVDSHERIPIFAVSASLVERERPIYVEAGFDGWILKPIDFKRLNVLLDGITNDGVRAESLYVPGNWERGGWFSFEPDDKSSRS